ncbi:MAG TPA: lytic transglycosylase domain-containing protein [Acetobacteraceae bacterium]
MLIGVLLFAAAPARAAGNPMPAIHADAWAQAAADASGYADPVAEKLVLYFRLLTPGQADAGEIAAFMADNPDWPNQAALERRRQEAIASSPSDETVLTQCTQTPITLPAALARCAGALADAGNGDAATAEARAAWTAGYADPVNEPAFLKRWAPILTPADEWARFQHFAWSEPAAAARQIARLAPDMRAAAKERLALIQNAPDAMARVLTLSPAQRDSPGLVLDEARWLRRARRDPDALAFWRDHGFVAEQTAGDHLAAFWAERNILARELLKDGDNQGAYLMADDHLASSSADSADSAFLAGFIALRRLHDAAAAIPQFQRLAETSHASITQARAYYWLGRAKAASGGDPRDEYERAATYPTTFYGQLAARALGEDPATRIDAAADPSFTDDQAWDFAAHELVRAAAILVAWGEPGRARAFLLRMGEVASLPREQALSARLALALGMPDASVFIARRMGLEGRMLPQDGWPMPVDPPATQVDPAVMFALMRQESSFDHGVVSPAGARGLMQLMPGTADAMARQIGAAPATQVSLVTDTAQNMQLGAAYLQRLLDQFSGSLPLAVAAYNAGPAKVSQWLADNGDPRTGKVDMVDWIELIPYGETRNYVQRVLENVTIYRARLHEAGVALLAQWSP